MKQRRLVEVIIKPIDKIFGGIMQNLSIRKKLIIFFLIISLGPILVIGSIVFFNSREAITDKITYYSIDSLTKSKQHMEMIVKKYEDLSYGIVANPEINKLFNDFTFSSGYERFLSRQNLEKYLHALIGSDSDLHTIRFLSTNGVLVDLHGGFDDFCMEFKESSMNEMVNPQTAPGLVPPITEEVGVNYHLVMGRLIRNPDRSHFG